MTDSKFQSTLTSTTEIDVLRSQRRALRQALTWCVVNSGETLGDHPNLLHRFREILGMDGEPFEMLNGDEQRHGDQGNSK